MLVLIKIFIFLNGKCMKRQSVVDHHENRDLLPNTILSEKERKKTLQVYFLLFKMKQLVFLMS